MVQQIGYGKFLDVISKHRNKLFAAAKDNAVGLAKQHGRAFADQAKAQIANHLGDTAAANIAQSAVESVHDSFQAGLSGSGAEFNGIGAPKALPFVIIVSPPSSAEAAEAESMGVPAEAIAGGAWAPFSWVKKTAGSAVDKAEALGSKAVEAVKKEAGNVLEGTIKPLFAKYKPLVEAAVNKGANEMIDVGFGAIEKAIAVEVPEIVGPMKALGLDKKLKKWIEGKVDGLLDKGIEEIMGGEWGYGAMLPGSGAMLPGSGAMLPGSGLGYAVSDTMQHPALRNAFHPSMLRRAR